MRWGQNNMIYSEPEIERIARVAMDVAQKRTGKCCSIDKANVLDVSQLWKDVVIRVHGECGEGVELSHMSLRRADIFSRESRRRRGRDADSPWRHATPRPRRG